MSCVPADGASAPSLDGLARDLLPGSGAGGYAPGWDGRSIATVAPLGRRAVCETGSLYLSEEEGIQIANLHRDGMSVVGTVRLASAVSRT